MADTTDQPQAKKWYQSRSVWSGVLKILAGLILSISSMLAGEMAMDQFLTGIGGSIWGIYDIVLRFNTSKSVTK